VSSTPETLASAAPLQPEDLTGFFRRGERPDPKSHKIGTEQEKFGVFVADGSYRPVEYKAHVLAVLQQFVDRYGWLPSGERGTDGALISLERDGASITLEPGGQFELSGRPLPDIHQTCQEFSQHQRELHAVSQELGIAWLASGFHPFATREEIDWMPKPRYAVMRAYLPTGPARARHDAAHMHRPGELRLRVGGAGRLPVPPGDGGVGADDGAVRQLSL
jgi:glutamate--cysteine ligase